MYISYTYKRQSYVYIYIKSCRVKQCMALMHISRILFTPSRPVMCGTVMCCQGEEQAFKRDYALLR